MIAKFLFLGQDLAEKNANDIWDLIGTAFFILFWVGVGRKTHHALLLYEK